MQYTFVGRESNWQKRYHVDKYIAQPMHNGLPAGKAVAFERQVPFRREKNR